MALMDFVIGGVIGIVAGLIIVPLGFLIYIKIQETKVRREIKKLINQGKMLMPLDKNDFDTEMWKDRIDLDEMKNTLENLDKKIFKRHNIEEMEVNTE